MSVSRKSTGAWDMSMIGAYKNDTMKMVRTTKPIGYLNPPDMGMYW